MKKHGRFWVLLVPALLLMLQSCRNDVDLKEFSKGNTLEVLKEKGCYKTFLKAVDMAGFSRLVGGGGLVTVFAPDDEAFSAYLMNRYGSEDLSAVPAEELGVLVGYHIIQFSYSPENFLSFATVTNPDGTSDGDGSCYKYKTYSKDPTYIHYDPIRQRNVNVYRRERYMPVFSSRLFRNRGVDMEKDYTRMFPSVNWSGDDDRLYAGSAVVEEAGIATDNGYLYTIDKVMDYEPTIYDFLNSSAGAEYSIIKKMFDRISCYSYDETTTKNYSETGDSLYFFYHWTAPTRAGEIPEIASEWTYHNEAGTAFERPLKYCSNCFLPKDSVLEPYLYSYFHEWINPEQPDLVKELPENTIYHFLMTHLFCNREIILPSELDASPLVGQNGEKFQLHSDDLEIKYCANGMVYGMDEVFQPAVFTHLTRPVFEHKDYMFWARALNVKNMYQRTVDDNNRFTMFVLNDHRLAELGYSSSESTLSHGSYTFRKNAVQSEAAVSSLLMSQFVYGDVDFETPGSTRYYVSKDDKTYFYVKDNTLYGTDGNAIDVTGRYETSNGYVYEIDNFIPARTGNYKATANGEEYTEFRALMNKAGLLDDTGGLKTPLKESMIFMPRNSAVILSRMFGEIPSDLDTLKQYLMYYFVPIAQNNLEHYLLPGLGPEGMTAEPFGDTYVTLSDYKYIDDAKYLSISWDPEHADHLNIISKANDTIPTVPDHINLHTNAAIFAVDKCFDYKTILR